MPRIKRTDYSGFWPDLLNEFTPLPTIGVDLGSSDRTVITTFQDSITVDVRDMDFAALELRVAASYTDQLRNRILQQVAQAAAASIHNSVLSGSLPRAHSDMLFLNVESSVGQMRRSVMRQLKQRTGGMLAMDIEANPFGRFTAEDWPEPEQVEVTPGKVLTHPAQKKRKNNKLVHNYYKERAEHGTAAAPPSNLVSKLIGKL